MRARQRVRRKRREEELEEEELQQEEAVAPQATPVDRVLDLQKTAGNRATGAAIARWGMAWLPLAAIPRWPKEPQATFDDELVLRIHSASDSRNPGTGAGQGARGSEDGRGTGGDMVVMAELGDHTAKLAGAVTRGKHFAKVEIVIPGPGGGVRYVLTDVVIASYSVSGNHETYTLNYSKREFSNTPPPK
jgi:hypothetical protein